MLYFIQGDSIKVAKTEPTKISFSRLFSFCCFDFMAWWIWENIWSVNGLSKALREVDSADKLVCRFLKRGWGGGGVAGGGGGGGMFCHLLFTFLYTIFFWELYIHPARPPPPIPVYVFVHNLLLKVVYSTTNSTPPTPKHTHILNGALLFLFYS